MPWRWPYFKTPNLNAVPCILCGKDAIHGYHTFTDNGKYTGWSVCKDCFERRLIPRLLGDDKI